MDIENITAAKSKEDPDYLTVDYIISGDNDFFDDDVVKNDEEIMRKFLKANPLNTDNNIVIQKIRLIDLMNSTQLQMNNKKEYNNKNTRIEKVLAEQIINMNFDERIKKGEPKLVDDIAKAANDVDHEFKILYSFASKYCYYHQTYALDTPKNDYPIYDSVLRKVLPKYINGVTTNSLENMFKEGCLYEDYITIIKNTLAAYNIDIHEKAFKGRPLSMLDHCLWYKNRSGGR